MDSILLNRLKSVAEQEYGLTIGDSFSGRLDSYTDRFFSELNSGAQRTIHLYLANAAFRIAKADQKHSVDEDDVKSAIWIYHLPEEPDDPCSAAGRTILERRNDPRFRRQLARPLLRILENYESPGEAV